MNKKLFYLLSLAWGLPMTICGALVALSLIVTGHRPKRFAWGWYFEIGKTYWGGLNLGPVFLCQHRASGNLKCHEFGHAIQNCWMGPLIIPLVIGSAARYHTMNRRERQGKPLPDYDAWWFEGQATKLGTKYYHKIKDEDVT